MKQELKTFKWTCDCCKAVEIVVTAWAHLPPNWIAVNVPAGPGSCGADYDYCGVCVIEAAKNHKPSEDNHFGRIIRCVLKPKKP